MLAKPASDAAGVLLRPMDAADLAAACALSSAVRWPHRAVDWEQALALGDGLVAERDGAVLGTGIFWRWGPRHGTLGLVIVSPECQGQGIGARLMHGLLERLGERSVLLQATAEGRALYERLGFVAIGGLSQHQAIARTAPLVGLAPGARLRPAGTNDLPALVALDTRGRGMPRERLVAALLASAEAAVVLDRDSQAAGYGLLRRFGRGHVIGPVVAPDEASAQALIAHLAGLNAGRFTRVDVDAASGLPGWLERIGLPCVGTPVSMLRGPALAAGPGVRTWATATQALG